MWIFIGIAKVRCGLSWNVMELWILCFSIIYLLFIFIFSYIFDTNIHPIYYYLSKISIENLIYFFFPKQLHTMIKFSLVFKLLLILHFVYYTWVYVLYFSCFLLSPSSFEGGHSLFYIFCPFFIFHTLMSQIIAWIWPRQSQEALFKLES